MKAVPSHIHSHLAIDDILVLWKKTALLFYKESLHEKKDWSFMFTLYSLKIWNGHPESSQKKSHKLISSG